MANDDERRQLLDSLTDAICDRDYSARRMRVIMRHYFGLPTPPLGKVEEDHAQRMRAEMEKISIELDKSNGRSD